MFGDSRTLNRIFDSATGGAMHHGAGGTMQRGAALHPVARGEVQWSAALQTAARAAQ